MDRSFILGSKAFAFIIVLCASMGAIGQTIKPYKVVTGPEAVKESTFSQVPQIMPTTLVVNREHDNPETPRFGSFSGSNSLPVGEVGKYSRGTLGAKFAGLSGTGYFPPDCDFAMGPNNCVAVVNLDMAFFSKSGTKQFQTNFATFFSSVGIQGDILSDPKVFYDKSSGRFFVTLIEVKDDPTTGISKMLVAVSDDSDPNGTWFKYRIEAKMVSGSDQWWLDYPGFGANKDAVVVTGNMFPLTGGTGYGGAQFIVMKKAPMLIGSPPTISYFRDPNVGTVQPMRTADASIDRIFLIDDFSSTQIKLYMLSNLLGTVTLDSKLVTVPSWQPPPTARSKGSSGIDALDGRFFTCMWKSNKFVAAHPVRDSGNNQVMLRWYEFDTAPWLANGNPTLTQAGNVRSNGDEDYSMPAIAINKFNDITMLFTRSGPSIVADMMIVSRKESDPIGTMGTPKKIETSGSAPYQAFRWGDYFAVAVDPTDNASFWGYGMIAVGTNWRTIWDKWTVTPTGGLNGLPVPPTSVSLYQGASSSGTTADATDSDDLYFTATSSPQGGLGQYAAIEADYTLGIAADQIDTLSVVFEGHDSLSGATAFVHLYNWTKGQYDSIKAFPLKTVDGQTIVNILGVNFADYVNASKEVKMVVRSVLPRPRGGIPPAYDFSVDQVILTVVSK